MANDTIKSQRNLEKNFFVITSPVGGELAN